MTTPSKGSGTAKNAVVDLAYHAPTGPDDPNANVKSAERAVEKARKQLEWAEANLKATIAEAKPLKK